MKDIVKKRRLIIEAEQKIMKWGKFLLFNNHMINIYNHFLKVDFEKKDGTLE